MPHADPRFDLSEDRPYRVFRLDDQRCVASAEVIYADGDAQAGVTAQTLQVEHSLELRGRLRRLAHDPRFATSGA